MSEGECASSSNEFADEQMWWNKQFGKHQRKYIVNNQDDCCCDEMIKFQRFMVQYERKSFNEYLWQRDS